MKPIRFEAGRSLTKSEKDEVLKSLGDSYKDHNAPKVLKGYDRISGDPRYGYEYNPDLMYTSDITGRLIRHYVVLPDGRKAHPTEIFPNVTKSEIDKYAMEREHAESLRKSRDESRAQRIADSKSEANEKYKRTGRKIEGSYFAQCPRGRIVRVDAKDADDVSFYEGRGFKQITPVVNMAKRNASAKKLPLPVEWQVRPLSWGGARWQHRQEEGDDVYDRPFTNDSDLEWYLADRYGWKFARKVLAALKTSTGEPVGERKKNPTASQSARWEKLWSNYIAALADLDKPASGARGKLKFARLAKAEKAIRAFDPEAYERLIAGRSNPDAMHPVLAKLNRRADKLKKPHMGEKGNQWRQLAFNELGDLDWPHIQRSHIPGVTIHSTPPPGVVWFPSSKNFKKRNPGRQHLPGLPAVAQREYEHILQGSRATGRYGKRAKEVAARTVRKQYGKNPYTDLVIKGQAKKVAGGWQVAGSKTGARGRGKVFESGRGTVQVASGVYLDKSSGLVYSKRERNMARRKRRNISEGFYDDTGFHPIRAAADYDRASVGEGKRKPRRARSKKKATAKRKTVKTARGKKRVSASKKPVTKRVVKKATKKRATTKRRNPSTCPTCTRPADQPYRQYDARGKCVAGCIDDFHTGHLITPSESSFWHNRPQAKKLRAAQKKRMREMMKGAPRSRAKNPTFEILVKDRFGPGFVHYGYREAATAAKAKDAAWKEIKSEYLYSKGEPRHKKSQIIARAKNPRKGSRRWRGSTKKTGTHRKEMYAESVMDRYNFGLSDDYEKFKKARDYMKGRRRSPNPKVKVIVKTKNKARRKGRRNPDAASIRKTFAGRVNKNSTLYFPDGTPGGLAKLGKLVKIKTRRGTIKLTRNPGEVWLCCDERGKFHLGSTVQAPLYAGAPGDLGEVEMIEYAESKPHLGYGKTIWFHKLGEEGGRKPTLHANGKGELRFKGGDYRITSRGIEN